LAFHFARVIGHIDLTPAAQLELVYSMLGGSGVHPGSEILDDLDRLVLLDPRLAIDALLERIGSQDVESLSQSRWLHTHRLISRLATRAGGDLFLEELQDRLSPELINALADHIDFSDQLPPSWLTELFEIAPDDEFAGRAKYNFLYPTGGWVGPESKLHRASRVRAIAWRDFVGESSKTGIWLTEVIAVLDRQIAVNEAREAERGW